MLGAPTAYTGSDQRTRNSWSACRRVSFKGAGPSNYQRLAAPLSTALAVLSTLTPKFAVANMLRGKMKRASG
jgi:hypothetical protein